MTPVSSWLSVPAVGLDGLLVVLQYQQQTRADSAYTVRRELTNKAFEKLLVYRSDLCHVDHTFAGQAAFASLYGDVAGLPC